MQYKVIPEKIIKESAFLSIELEGANNSFFKLLLAAEEFKKADMTPVFILDVYTMRIKVIAKETHKKKLH